jgi:hypothetical protein
LTDQGKPHFTSVGSAPPLRRISPCPMRSSSGASPVLPRPIWTVAPCWLSLGAPVRIKLRTRISLKFHCNRRPLEFCRRQTTNQNGPRRSGASDCSRWACVGDVARGRRAQTLRSRTPLIALVHQPIALESGLETAQGGRLSRERARRAGRCCARRGHERGNRADPDR